MDSLDLKESVCPQEDETIVYFDDFKDVLKYAKVVPTASANISYFEPQLQQWAMVNEKRQYNSDSR